MAWINWEIFTKQWLKRAERGQKEHIDDGDRFISLWIAFNGWMKEEFGEFVKDRTLINHVKAFENIRNIFLDLRREDDSFGENLNRLGEYSVADMRNISDPDAIKRYDGTFDSLVEVIYQVRCNLFHGRKEIHEDKKDFELVSLSYKILLPLFKRYLERSPYSFGKIRKRL